jgi:hypothetical protein
MAKNNKVRVGQEVVFNFAGSHHTGTIVKILDENKVKVYDKKYLYPVLIKDIINKKK